MLHYNNKIMNNAYKEDNNMILRNQIIDQQLLIQKLYANIEYMTIEVQREKNLRMEMEVKLFHLQEFVNMISKTTPQSQL